MAGHGDSFDYVIVGAGTAGSLLAARLSEDPRCSVCVLEAGPADHHPFIHLPAGYIKMLQNPRYTWRFMTEPAAGTAGRRIATTQGRVLGGSSSINGLIYNRGQRADFDEWAERGNPGWSYAEVLPYFRRSEHRMGVADARYRGREGALPVTDIDWHHPISDAFMAAAEGAGIPRNADYNGASQDGVGTYQRVIHRGVRVSAAKAFLRSALRRANVLVLTGVQATAIDIADGRAVAVRYVRGGPGGALRRVQARREIIVCGGAINSPKLLQLSGIGPPALLRQHGIAVCHELAGVGENLRDHYAVRMVARVRNSLTINETVRGWRLLREMARWAAGRPSVLSLSPSLVHVFWKSAAALNRPDLQLTFTPASYREGIAGLLDVYPGMTCGVWQQRPQSLGHVRLASADPALPPLIQPNYLQAPIDQQVMIDGIRLGRRLLRAPALAAFYERETSPDPAQESDAELLDFARQLGSTVFHLIGTCRMGPRSDPTAVVGADLKLHGLDGLRVADASIMPTMPSANTAAATYMIAEKAADLIGGRSLPPAAQA